MSSLNSLSAGHINPKTMIGSYERNVKAFGPATAAVIGAADAMVSAASSTYSFSNEALDQLSAALSEGVDAITSTIGDAADSIESVADGAMDAIESVGDAVVAVGDASDQVAEGIGEAIGELSNYLIVAGLAVGSMVSLSA